MAFAKAFLLSLAAYVGINFLFVIISSLINDTFDVLFSIFESGPNYAPMMILHYFFGSITIPPSSSIASIVNFEDFELSILVSGIGYLIAPLIAAILSGIFGESKVEAFGGWLLTAAISAGMIILAFFLSGTVEGTLDLLYGPGLSQMMILMLQRFLLIHPLIDSFLIFMPRSKELLTERPISPTVFNYTIN